MDFSRQKPNLIISDTDSAQQELTPAAMRLINAMPDPGAALVSVQQLIGRGAQTVVLITTSGRMIGALVMTPDDEKGSNAGGSDYRH